MSVKNVSITSITFILSFQIELLRTKQCLPFESAIVVAFLLVDL